MAQAAYKRVVKGKAGVLEERADLPEGTEVIVTPLEAAKGSPLAILAAIDAPPHLKLEDVEELGRFAVALTKPVHPSTSSGRTA